MTRAGQSMKQHFNNNTQMYLHYREDDRDFCGKLIDLLFHRSRDLLINPTIRKRKVSCSVVLWICDTDSPEHM